METYEVVLKFKNYPNVIGGNKSNTPYDSFEKQLNKTRNRWKEDFLEAEVTILDGTKRKWNFK